MMIHKMMKILMPNKAAMMTIARAAVMKKISVVRESQVSQKKRVKTKRKRILIKKINESISINDLFCLKFK